MKTANDQVRDMFRKTIAGLFGGEKFMPDAVRKLGSSGPPRSTSRTTASPRRRSS